MPMHGGHLWHKHPGVRSGEQLSLGERAADHLKATFGSWGFLIVLNVFIAGWIGANILLPHASRWDVYTFILLNLGLSWLAAQQGGALQIAANRGDRINSEVAAHTQANTDELMTINRQQLQVLTKLDGLDGKVADLAEAVQVVMAARNAQPQVVNTTVNLSDAQVKQIAEAVEGRLLKRAQVNAGTRPKGTGT